LGSPTEIMQQYRFDLLLDMILTTKKNLPIEEPLHLFGAGHPFMFSFAVALGCDLFDSAAYAIYARNERYMTEYGTHKLKDLEYFPCPCPSCNETDPEEVQGMAEIEKQAFLAEHNLYSCQAEMKRIKTAIKEGRLWELLQTRAHVHPTLFQAVKLLRKYEEYIEKHSPTIKKGGIFFYSSVDLARPEVVRHRKRLVQRYSQPEETETLILMPQTQIKPLHNSKLYKETAEILRGSLKKHKDKIHVCFYTGPFGVVPVELDEVYPLSQHEIALPLDREIINYVAEQVANYIEKADYETVVLIHDPENWKKEVLNACIETCKRANIQFECLNIKEKHRKTILTDLKNILLKKLREKP
jgi:7-cyano-7-deazaguanine tRNA-ribosyltransferase